MKKWIFAFIIIFIIIILSFCGRNENKFTVQEKLKNNNYQYIAYKEKINQESAQIIKKGVRGGDWKKSEIDLDENPSDYIFYFNYERDEGAVSVYHLWLKVNPLKVTIYSEKMEMQLEGEKAKQFVERVLDVKFNRK